MGTYLILFLDSVEISGAVFQSINPMDISNITVLLPKTAKKNLGEKGRDGAVYTTTIKFAKQTYWAFFGEKSEAYKQLFSSPRVDSTALYIINGKEIPDDKAPGELFSVANKNFKTINVIDKEKQTWDNVSTKRYVVVITAKPSK